MRGRLHRIDRAPRRPRVPPSRATPCTRASRRWAVPVGRRAGPWLPVLLLAWRRARRLHTAGARGASEFDLRAQLDDSVRRKAEELRGRPRVAPHEHEQLLAPPGHRRVPGGDQLFAPEVERRVGLTRAQAQGLAPRQDLLYARLLL